MHFVVLSSQLTRAKVALEPLPMMMPNAGRHSGRKYIER